MKELPDIHQFHWTRWHIGITACVFAIVFIISLRSYTDPDLWGHLRFGLDAIEQRRIVQVDPYSYLTEGYRWINHEWLMEVLMGMAWLIGRDTGLILLRVIVTWLTLGLVFWRLVHSVKLPFIPALLVWLCVVLTTIWFSLVVRPQVFTFLFFTCTLIIIDEAERGRYRLLWLMPVIVALWVNLHGGFLAGCGVLGVWTIVHLFFNPQQWRSVAPPVAVTALATLVNPYGYELLHFLLETATGDRPEIADWQPLPIRSPLGLIYLAVMSLAIWAGYVSPLPRNIVLMGLFGLVGMMPLVAIRHLPLMGIAFAIFIAPHVGAAWQASIGRQSRDVPIPRWLQPLPLVGSGFILLFGMGMNQWSFISATSVPYHATTLLRESGFRGRLMCDFGWGQYLIWHLGPQVRVGMDGRRETVYPPDIYEEYVDFHFGVGNWDAILRRQQPDAVLVGRGSAPANLLALHSAWRQVFADDESVLFIRIDSTAAMVIDQTARSFVPSEVGSVFP